MEFFSSDITSLDWFTTLQPIFVHSVSRAHYSGVAISQTNTDFSVHWLYSFQVKIVTSESISCRTVFFLVMTSILNHTKTVYALSKIFGLDMQESLVIVQ